jgi:hypothetical protein
VSISKRLKAINYRGPHPLRGWTETVALCDQRSPVDSPPSSSVGGAARPILWGDAGWTRHQKVNKRKGEVGQSFLGFLREDEQ